MLGSMKDIEKELDEIESEEASFLSLPTEVLLHIFSYVDSSTILHSLRFVCKRFNRTLHSELDWRSRFANLVENHLTHSVVRVCELDKSGRWYSGYHMSWRQLCYSSEREKRLWSLKPSFYDEDPEYGYPHFATIDGIKILPGGELCASGARDRSVVLWSISDNKLSWVDAAAYGHTGWVWDIKDIDADTFLSADWVGTVLKWKIRPTGLTIDQSFKVTNPALCLNASREFYIVGLHSSFICFLDPRIGLEDNISLVKVHTRSVQDIFRDDHKVVTISDDKTITLTDIRTMSAIKTYPIANAEVTVTMSRVGDVIYVGDTGGQVHCLSYRSNFKTIQTMATRCEKISCINATAGSLFIASRMPYIDVYFPTNPPKLMSQIDFGTEITRMDRYKDIVAVARADNRISVFKSTQTEN